MSGVLGLESSHPNGILSLMGSLGGWVFVVDVTHGQMISLLHLVWGVNIGGRKRLEKIALLGLKIIKAVYNIQIFILPPPFP